MGRDRRAPDGLNEPAGSNKVREAPFVFQLHRISTRPDTLRNRLPNLFRRFTDNSRPEKERRPPLMRLLCVGMLLATGATSSSAQISKLPHADTTAGNFFGVSVSIDGRRALVGASAEDACGENSGAAYVYERDPETDQWAETARLTASDCDAGDFFGRSLSLSGNRALIAAAATFFNAQASNAAYIFERNDSTGVWEEAARLTAEPGREEGAFATSVDLDGDRALITTSGDPSGRRYNGAAYIFERDPVTGVWNRTARLTGSKGMKAGVFGGAGALDGDRAVVAASTYFQYRPGTVYIFERDPETGRWREAATIGDIDDFFISVDISGDRVIIGESKGGKKKAGVATLLTRTASGAWKPTETFHPAYPYDYGAFGSLAALDGDRVLISGYDEQLGFSFNIDRVVYLFAYDPETGSWRQQRVLDIGEVDFGASLSIDGNSAVIGQASEGRAGAAHSVHLP